MDVLVFSIFSQAILGDSKYRLMLEKEVWVSNLCHLCRNFYFSYQPKPIVLLCIRRTASCNQISSCKLKHVQISLLWSSHIAPY